MMDSCWLDEAHPILVTESFAQAFSLCFSSVASDKLEFVEP